MNRRKDGAWGSLALEWGLGLHVPLPRVLGKLLISAAVVSAVAGLGTFIAYPSESLQSLAGALAADLGGTLWLFLWLGKTPDGKLALNPLTGLLGLYSLRRLLGLLFVASQSTSFSSPFGFVPTGDYIAASAKAEWVTLLGTVMFCVGWMLARKRAPRINPICTSAAWRDRQLWFTYAVGLAGYLMNWLLPDITVRLGNLFTVTSSLAYGSIFALLAFSTDFGIRGRLNLFTYAACLPLIANVLTYGMKSAFFLALLPIGAAYLLFKPGRGLALGIAGLLVMLIFVYPYVEEYRATNWGNAPGASVGEVARQVQQNIEQEGATHTAKDSWEKFELRFGSVNEAGAVVYFADHSGFMGMFFIKNLIYGFIPRLIWPGKPTWDPSAWFTAYLNGTSEASVGSATALHIAPELYWMYGWLGTMVGMLFLGLFYRKVSDWLLASGAKSPVYWAAWYGLLQFTTFIEEARVSMAVLTPFILLANVFAVSWVIRTLVPPRSTPRLRPAGSHLKNAPTE
jgi:hypothetical protein